MWKCMDRRNPILLLHSSPKRNNVDTYNNCVSICEAMFVVAILLVTEVSVCNKADIDSDNSFSDLKVRIFCHE